MDFEEISSLVLFGLDLQASTSNSISVFESEDNNNKPGIMD